jgi:AraC family transcriptional regulator
MGSQALASVSISPREAIRSQVADWHGIKAEIVQFTGEGPFEYEFRAPVHLFIACDRAVRIGGETRVDGLVPSSLRDFSRKLCFVPAGRTFRGSFVPKVLPRTTYFYIDPICIPADPELRFAEIDFLPRLFFDDAALWGTVQKLNWLIENPSQGSRLYADALISVLGVELARLQNGWPAPVKPARGGLAGWQQRIVRDYIEENVANDIPLADLAALARLSPTHFSRAFKGSFGVSPQRYQLERRIEQAKRLLADQSRSITEISLSCGFEFPGNFTTAFRKATAKTPTEFRRALL